MQKTLLAEVFTALTGTGYPVAYFFAHDNPAFPRITFYESNNREYAQTGGVEFATEVEYTVDLWATTPEKTAEMAESVDNALAALRLRRTFSHDLYEQDTRIHHKNMRYRAVIRLDEQKIYQ